MSDSRVIQLASHKQISFEPFSTKSAEWVLNGKDNEVYNYVIDCYNGSPTNATIIDSYSNFVYGQGLYNGNEKVELIKEKDLRNAVKDYSMFEEIAFEIIQGKVGNKVVQVNHLPKNKVVPNKVNEKGEIDSYWYSYDWSDVKKYPPERIPIFKIGTNEKRTVMIVKTYAINQFYFSRPSYYSGLKYAELEEAISTYCINHINNGLSAGHIINFNDGEADDEVKDKIERNINKKLGSQNNAGKIILSFNANKENATTIEAIEVSDAHQQYQFLSEEARKQIMVAHKVTSPILFGIKDNTGFGNNADEMSTAFDELMVNVIKPKTQTITDAIKEIFEHNGILDSDLKFKQLKGEEEAKASNSYNGAQISSAVEVITKVKEGILTKEQAIVFLIQFLQMPKDVALSLFTPSVAPIQQLSKQSNEEIVANKLIELGEVEDLENYELIECKPVDYEEEDKITHKFSTSTGTANPNRKSIYDTDYYIFRYRYAGNPNPEREFCKNMMKANKIYRREDIEAMTNVVVNPGFGKHPNPNDPYSIWLYKGGGLLSAEFPGGTCKHYWEKLTYRIKDVKIDPKSPIAIDDAKKDRASGIAGIAPHDR